MQRYRILKFQRIEQAILPAHPLSLFLRTVVPEAVGVYKHDTYLTKTAPNHNGLTGNFPIRQDCPFEKYTESKGSQIKQTEQDTDVNWHVEASKRLQKSKMFSMADSLQKLMKNERRKRYLKQKTVTQT